MISSKNILWVLVLTTVLLTAASASGSTVSVDAKKPEPKPKPQPKTVKVVHISADVDGTKVVEAGANISEIYTVVLSSGSYVSKAKEIDANTTTGNFNVQFAGKLPASAGDTFTITLVSNDEQFSTVASIGTFTEKQLGKSGKSQLEGTTDTIILEPNEEVGVS